MKPEDLNLMRKIDELYTDDPSRGSRSVRRQLGRQGIKVNRKRIQRLMRLMGIEAVYPKPRTTRRHPGHKVYPYLLRNLAIHAAQSGLGGGYNIYTHEPRFYVSCRHHGLVQPQNHVVASIQYHGVGLLCRSATRGPESVWTT